MYEHSILKKSEITGRSCTDFLEYLQQKYLPVSAGVNKAIYINLMKKFVLVVEITIRMITVAPVSYTHLDVYKRQGWGRGVKGWVSHIFCLFPI